jgi:hypothetical protein
MAAYFFVRHVFGFHSFCLSAAAIIIHSNLLTPTPSNRKILLYSLKLHPLWIFGIKEEFFISSFIPLHTHKTSFSILFFRFSGMENNLTFRSEALRRMHWSEMSAAILFLKAEKESANMVSFS